MNVSPKRACASSSSNAVRLSTYSGNLGERHVILNIPAAQIETVEGGRVSTRHTAVVGKIDRQSPISTRACRGELPPFWDTPSTIIKKDSSPKCGPSRTTSPRTASALQRGQPGDPPFVGQLALNEAMKLPLPAGPGRTSTPGHGAHQHPNPHGVFVHARHQSKACSATSSGHSSGCVRVQNVRDYVAGSSGDTPGMTREVVDEAFASGRRLDVKVADPVAVLLGLHHRLGDAGRPGAVPGRHLQPRRPRRDGDGPRRERAVRRGRALLNN
jgi:murein L,D-transpeptidase YcbB/YkuD